MESRDRAGGLSAELEKVYVEAEKLRTEGAAAKQRIAQLERQFRGRGARATAPAPCRADNTLRVVPPMGECGGHF